MACLEVDQVKCHNTNRCIYASYVCDGDGDCEDWSDELNCSEFLSVYLFVAYIDECRTATIELG